MVMDPAKTNDVTRRLVEKLRIMVRHEIRHGNVVTRRQAVITATSAGPPPTVSVRIGGSLQVVSGVRYLASYTPSVGHTVWVDIQNEDLIVIGRLA